jgi:hypothetical protein
VSSSPFANAGIVAPSAAPAKMLHDAAVRIGRQAYTEGVIGYCGVEFVLTYADRSDVDSDYMLENAATLAPHAAPSVAAAAQRRALASVSPAALPLLYPIDFKPYVTDSLCAFWTFDLLMRGRMSTNPRARRASIIGNNNNGNGNGNNNGGGGGDVDLATAADEFDASGSHLTAQYLIPATNAVTNGSGGGDGNDGDEGAPARGAAAAAALSSATALTALLRDNAASRHYACVTRVFQPNLASTQLAAFFHLCRLQGVSFDMRSRRGSAFLLPDSMASATLGCLSIGDSRCDALDRCVDALSFLVTRVARLSLNYAANGVGAQVGTTHDANLDRVLVAMKRARDVRKRVLLVGDVEQAKAAEQTVLVSRR